MVHVPTHPWRWHGSGPSPASPPRCWLGLVQPEARALFAGVAAHALRALSSPMSSAIGVALATAAHAYGWPVAQGGSSAISIAMVAPSRSSAAR